MQSYLGEYPGSRSDSDQKFLRAVQSFINQTDKDSELIIVSDACSITHELYYKHYKDNPRIKYVYVDKDVPNMYEGQEKYYRGLPRQVGRTIASGEITAYMDSDDIIIERYVEYLKYFWNMHPDKNWAINISWYDNIHRKENPIGSEEALYEDPSNEPSIKIKGLESEWYAVKGKPNAIPMQSSQLSHKSICTTLWKDTINRNEDVDFNKRLRTKYDNGFRYIEPIYVRCHCSNRWDY